MQHVPAPAASMRLSAWAFWRTWFIGEGYIYEWLAAIILAVFNHVVPLLAIAPVERFYSSNDPTLSYPASSSTISGSLLYVLAFLFPGVVIVLYACITRSFHDAHHGLLSLLESFAIACGWKRWMNIVGVLRPRWLTVLATGVSADIDDARQSYPSGHSAYSFCGCVVLTLYMLGKFKVLSQPGKGQFVLAIVSLMPTMLATFVAVSRIYDYQHAPADVNAGCFIGFMSAVFAYFLNYHSVLGLQSAEPKARKWTTRGLTAYCVEPSGQPLPVEGGEERKQDDAGLPPACSA